MRASERSDFYGMLLEPPRPTPAILAAARARPAETVVEHLDRMARKKTMPAPKSRRRGPRGRTFHGELADDENWQMARRRVI